MLRVIIIAQQDRFFIPANIKKVIDIANVVLVINNNYKSSLENKKADFLRWFGPFQAGKMAMKQISCIVKGFLDEITGYRLFCGKYGIEHVARANSVDYMTCNNINDPTLVNKILHLEPDLIISFSAPQVIKESLLSIPRLDIINVHGSYLPDYRGCFPSFWQLLRGEKYAGATVHVMSEKIDDGRIVVQDKVSISDCKTIFEVIARTKALGGDLVVRAIAKIQSGDLSTVANDTSQGCYYTWPKKDDTKRFHKKGLRLV